MWAAIASFILGVTGWFVSKFLFEPWKEIANLRRDTQECLILHGNLSKDAPPDERVATSSAFRRIGAALISRHAAAFPWENWLYARVLRWDIHSAGELLIAIANTTQFEGYSMVSVSPTVVQVRDALRLPTPTASPVVRALREHAAQPPLGNQQ